jgi:hypothetical protein
MEIIGYHHDRSDQAGHNMAAMSVTQSAIRSRPPRSDPTQPCRQECGHMTNCPISVLMRSDCSM